VWNSEIKMPNLMRFMYIFVCEHGEKCCAYLVGACLVTVIIGDSGVAVEWWKGGRKEGRREGENAAGYGIWIFASNYNKTSDCCYNPGSTNGVFVKDL
jgi:hypothetical protein